MVKIAPSILNADFSRLPEQVREVSRAGADWIHLDIMDGNFVPNITFGPLVVAGVRKLTSLPLDVHLMIQNADAYVQHFRNAGADLLTVHVEACPHLWRTIDSIHEMGAKAGITMNPATSISLIEPILEKVELVLVMSVEPGFGGQQFIPQSIDRIARLNEYRIAHNLSYEIQVDGGIDLHTAPLVVAAGADVLVIGTAIFKSADIAASLLEFREIVKKNSQ